MTLTPDQIANLRQRLVTECTSPDDCTYISAGELSALADAADELDRIKRVSATDTAENFAKLPESALREFFAVHIEESERRKAAEGLIDQWAKYIAREHPDGAGDHACAECRPCSDILIDGFQCVPHQAMKLLKGRGDES